MKSYKRQKYFFKYYENDAYENGWVYKSTFVFNYSLSTFLFNIDFTESIFYFGFPLLYKPLAIHRLIEKNQIGVQTKTPWKTV